MRSRAGIILGLIGLLALPAAGAAAAFASQPIQRESGPGGRDYTYERVVTTSYGRGADQYWIFEPAEADKTKPLPVIGLLHGLNATDYSIAWLWIEHLVRKGNVVVCPQYQQGLLLDHTTFTDKSAAALAQAIKQLDGDKHCLADRERFALAGHSLGGTIAANLAARHEHYQLPLVRAVMSVLPGDVKAERGLAAFLPSMLDDHTTIPRGTLMLVIAAEDDGIVGQRTAKAIYNGATGVAAEDKSYLLLHADDYGRPALIADHLVPLSYIDRHGQRRADALDFALWRWLDALTDAAFNGGRYREIALGNTPEQRDLGRWSDGTPVRQPTVMDQP